MNNKFKARSTNTLTLPIGITVKFVLGAWLTLTAGNSKAQDLEPRSYTNIPIGMNFLVLGAAHSTGGVSPSPSTPIEDTELTINSAVIGYAHTFNLAGKSAKIDMSAARICFKGSAESNGEQLSTDRCGYGDPNVRLTWNFFGAPALPVQDFARWDQGLVMGTSLQVSLPIGSYDENRLVNAGANRWVLRPGIGISQKFGQWYYDAIMSVRFYSNNNHYFSDTRLKQQPQFTLQGHLIYNFNKGHWLSLNTNFFFGGETEKDNIGSQDYQQNSRFGLTYSMPITRQQSIKFYASTGVITQVGNDFNTYGALWQYSF